MLLRRPDKSKRAATSAEDGRLEQPHSAQASALLAGEHQVIDDGAIDRFGGASEPSRQLAIRFARAGVAAGVIMRQHDARAAMTKRVLQDRLHWEMRATLVTFMTGDVEATRVIIDMGYPQALTRRVRTGEAAFEKAPRRPDSVEPDWQFGTLMEHRRNVGPRRDSNERNRVRYCGESLHFGGSYWPR